MKIISTHSCGIKDPESGEEFEWEGDEEALCNSSLITEVLLHSLADSPFIGGEFFCKWEAFYKENKNRIDKNGDEEYLDVDELLEEFDSPHFALEVTTGGGPSLSTIYFILEEKYESQLDRLLIR